MTRRAGLESAAIRWDAGCSFVDYDLDGKLDLVVTGYVDFDVAKVPKPGSGGFCMWKGMPVMCGLADYPPAAIISSTTTAMAVFATSRKRAVSAPLQDATVSPQSLRISTTTDIPTCL